MQRRASFEIIFLCGFVIGPVYFPSSALSFLFLFPLLWHAPCSWGGGRKEEDVHLLPTKDQPLLDWRNTLFFFDFFFDLADLFANCQ
jgi:hypothetical protein